MSRESAWTPVIWGIGAIYGQVAENRGNKPKPWLLEPGCFYWDDVRLIYDHHGTHKLASLKEGTLRLFDYSEELLFEAVPANVPFFWRRIPEICQHRLGVSHGFYSDKSQEHDSHYTLKRGELYEITLTRAPAFSATVGAVGIDLAELERRYDVPGLTRQRLAWLRWFYEGSK